MLVLGWKLVGGRERIFYFFIEFVLKKLKRGVECDKVRNWRLIRI